MTEEVKNQYLLKIAAERDRVAITALGVSLAIVFGRLTPAEATEVNAAIAARNQVLLAERKAQEREKFQQRYPNAQPPDDLV